MNRRASPRRYRIWLAGSSTIVLALFLAFNATGASVQSQKVTRANYELAHKFSEENLKKMLFDLNVMPNWINQTDRFWYRWETSAGVHFYLVDPVHRSTRKVFDNAVMAAELSRTLKKPFNPAHLPIDSLNFVNNDQAVQFELEGNTYEYDRIGESLKKIPIASSAGEGSQFTPAQLNYFRSFTGGGTPKGSYLYSPDDRWAVFIRNHNLFLIDAKDPQRKEYQLTSDGQPYYSFNSFNEADTSQDKISLAFVTWFPDSRHFFARRTDRRKVRDLWLLEPLSQPRPTLRTFKYAMAGDENIDQDELFVFDCEKKKATRIMAEKWKDQKIGGKAQDGGVYAVPGSDKVYFMRTDRTWRKIDFCEADPETGDVKTIIGEESQPNFTVTSAQVKLLSGGKEIIWWSDRDGWGHYYLYDDQGHLKRQITSGPFICRSIVKIDVLSRVLFFTATGKEGGVNPYFEHLYSVGLDGQGLKCLTPENANHDTEHLSLSESGKYFLDNYSRVDHPPQAVVRDAAGNKILDLEPPDLSRLKAAGWKTPEAFKIKAADNVTDLYGVMWKPFDLDPGKKYPIVLFTYPGPISEVVPKDFNPLTMPVTGLSQLGFVVVMFGNRGGSAERSKWYNTFGYGNLRDYSLPDKKAGLEQLAQMYSFIDIDRVGVMGGSGGGFQSTALMFTYPDFFKVCVSWAGNNDNNIFENYWPELNQGLKEIQEKGETRFEINVPTNAELAKNLKGHYLIMHGLRDSRVHPSQSYRVIQALIEANKPFDMYIIPDEQHQFTKAKYLPYLLRIIWHYFAHNLMGDPRSKAEIFAEYESPVYNSPWMHN